MALRANDEFVAVASGVLRSSVRYSLSHRIYGAERGS